MRTLKSLILITFALCILIHANGQNEIGQQVAKVSPAGTQFWLYTPPGYNTANPAPMLVGLAGGGEISENLTKITSESSHWLPSKLIWQELRVSGEDGFWPSNRPFIVVSPLLNPTPPIHINDQEWSSSVIDEVIEYVRTLRSIDQNRLYLTGISLGGAACWDYAAAYPDKVAAMVPCSGKTNTTNACNLKDIAIWAFHGENDTKVNPLYTIDMVRVINACLPSGKYKAHLNLTYSRGHSGWSEIYNGSNGYAVFDWMLQFEKNASTNKSPYVNAGIDQKVLLRTGSLHLPAEFFDSDGTITNVSWSQISGPVTLSLEQTDTKFLKINSLVAGQFKFKLEVIDDLGALSADSITLDVLTSAPTGESVITDLILVNANGSVDIGPITEGMIIDVNLLNTNQFFLKAVGNTNTGSIRFRINSDQNVATGNTPGGGILSTGPKADDIWTISDGDYIICATPYKLSTARNSPGLSQVFKVRVRSNVFYSKAGTDVSILTSWSSTPDGTGSSPTTFTEEAYQTFNVINTVNVDNAVAIGASTNRSSLWIRQGGLLKINKKLTAYMNAETNSTINVNTNETVNFQFLSPNSQVNLEGTALTVPSLAFQYGNLTLIGSAKKLAANTRVFGNLIIQNGATLNTDNKTLNLGGNFTNNGAFTAGTQTVTLNGTGAQTLSGPTTFYNLVINKSTGHVTLNGSGPSTVNGILTLTSGNIVPTTTNKLILGAATTISGGSSKSFIDGPVGKIIGSGATFTFPAGSVSPSRYRPVTIGNTSASDTWTVQYSATDPSTDGYSHNIYNPTTLTKVSEFEYWDISRLGSTSANLTLSYGTGSYNPPNIGDVSKLRIAHWDGAKWDLPEGGGTISRTGDNISGTITVTNVTSFSPLTIGAFEGPLPVVWSDFNGQRVGNSVILDWTTAMEKNNKHFQVERSADDNNFNPVASIAAGKKPNEEQRYQFIDSEVSDHITYYYRIRQVDFDGKYEFSDVIAVLPHSNRANTRWVAYPNPIREKQQFQIVPQDRTADAPDHTLEAQVTSPTGILIFKVAGKLSDINNKLETLIHTLSPGMYSIQLTDGAYQQHFRVGRY